MYRLEEVEELLSLPEKVDKCIIGYQNLLEYVYKSKTKAQQAINIELLREILLKNIREGYEKNYVIHDIVITRKELDKLCVKPKTKKSPI